MAEISERSVFLEALELESADLRAEYLDRACSGNQAFRAAVEQLLAAHELPGNLLDQPMAAMPLDSATVYPSTVLLSPSVAVGPGTIIGPYRLMEQIGEGGFGLVFVAEQHQPVRRKVALKVIKPGMDTRDVIARFEAERQALAMMDHPNIAKVFDAGTTDGGRPYFVMELVHGIPITEFCSRHEFDLPARLELFISVCSAVQHAHQKGIIHRDIKPSNVLVTLHDDTSVPKVIDFGIAKAVGQSLTDKTIYTSFAAMMGTPLYMSPEQAKMSGLDVDTRSDIYSLGVLLYELLTGSTPFDRDRFSAVGPNEVRRIICEEDPPRPSTRLTTAAAAAASTMSASRRRLPTYLSTAVRGDLDWIVMKTLEKSRERRYESASALADDVRRFVAEQPVVARPPSRFYLLSKFARRNKASLVTTLLIAIAMLLGTAVSLWQASVAVSERNEKDDALQDAIRLQREADAAREEIAQFATRMKEANELVSSGRAHADAERWAAAYADFSAAIERQPNYFDPWTERASLEVKLGQWELAAKDYAKAIELGVPIDNPANWGIPQLFLMNGDTAGHREYCRALLSQARKQDQSASVALIRSCVMATESVSDPESLAERALEWVAASEQHPGPLSPPPGPPRERPFDFPRPLAERRPRRDGPPPPGFGRMQHPRGASHYTAGVALYRAGRYDEAIEQLNQALSDDHWRAQPIVYPALAMAYHRAGNSSEARKAFTASEAAIEQWTLAMQQGPIGSMPIPWFDWIECQLLHREASILLTGFAPADDPRLRDVQERGRRLIQGGSL